MVRALLQETTVCGKEIWVNDNKEDATDKSDHGSRPLDERVLTIEEARLWGETGVTNRARLRRDAHKLHVHCGHRPPEVLARAL